MIERQVLHLTRLVDDLLDVSRIAQGKVTLHKELVSLADVVARAIEVASPLLEQKSHALSVNVPPSGLWVEVDVARLTQVVSNLLTNAGRYTPAGGRIVIESSEIDGEIELRVRDNGIGMTPDVLATAFDRFVQGQQAIDRAEGGLGLGLTIVRSLVERHGGSVTAFSDGPGKGSELVVRLPRATHAVPVETPAAETPALASQARAVRVLVVDDNRDAAEMLATALDLHGCEVAVAHDGLEALAIGATREFHIAFLDIGLPVMDGYELVGRLRELPTFASTRLVALTGYGQDSDRRRALAAGFHDHLVKPVDLARVESLISEVGR